MSYEDFDIDDVIAQEDSHQPNSEDIGATNINWRELPNSFAAETWIELRSWVEWICQRYAVGAEILPDCWWRHGALVEELSALHAAWTASYDSTDAGYGPIGFVERWHNAQVRLRHLSGSSCSQGHRPDRVRNFADDPIWTQWITTTHA